MNQHAEIESMWLDATPAGRGMLRRKMEEEIAFCVGMAEAFADHAESDPDGDDGYAAVHGEWTRKAARLTYLLAGRRSAKMGQQRLL